MKRWRELNLRGKAKLVTFSVLPTLVLLLCAEFLARGTIQRKWWTKENPATGRSEYTMRIGRFPWGRISVTPLNSLGFPDDEFAGILPKRECIHIVFAGDSFVFGDGVDRDKSFPQLVKKWSAERNPDRCLRFFNVAERGSSIERQARHILDTYDLIRPDIVLLGQYQNDLTDLMKPDFIANSLPDSVEGARRWIPFEGELTLGNLALVRLISYHSFAFAIRHNVHWDLLSRWSILEDPKDEVTAEHLMGIYSGLYSNLVQELRARGVELGVLILPSKFDVMAGRSPEEPYFIELAQEHDVPYLRLFPTFDSHRSSRTFLLYDGHANEYGNQVIAQEVYNWLFEAARAPFPELRARPEHPDSTTGLHTGVGTDQSTSHP